jgi:hypothetical protein
LIGCVVRQIVNWSDKTIVCLERYSYKVRWNNKYVENKWFSVINYCYNDYIFYCQNVSILPWFLRFFKLDFRTVPMVLWILFFIMISFYINKRAFVNKYVINHHASLVTLGLLSEKWIVLLTLFEFKIFYMRVSILNTCEQHFISLRREVWAHKTSLTCTKPGELEIIYMCVTVFHFAAVFFFSILRLNFGTVLTVCYFVLFYYCVTTIIEIWTIIPAVSHYLKLKHINNWIWLVLMLLFLRFLAQNLYDRGESTLLKGDVSIEIKNICF